MQGKDLVFRKSSYSNGQAECVEVAVTADGRAVRDSKDTTIPMASFSDSIWGSFIRGLKDGDFAA
jgi:hypothetical protein